MKTCLIVEDSEIIREILARMVRDLGLEVHEAPTPAAGMSQCQERLPDVIMLDWDLPKLGALDVLRGIGAIESVNRPAIILLATENDPQQFMLAKAAGAAFHVLKPFNKQIIATTLGEAGIIDPSAEDASRAAS